MVLFLFFFLNSGDGPASVAGLARADERRGPDRHRSDGNGEDAGIPAARVYPHGRSSCVSAGASQAVCTEKILVAIYRFSVDPNLSGTARACWS